MRSYCPARILLACILGSSLICMATAASATTVSIVSGNMTPGDYNTAVGDLGAPSGTLPWFPAPFTFTGTQQVFASAPDLSAATAALGNWLADPANLNANWNTVSAIPMTWTVNNEVAIVYSFDAGAGLQNMTADFGKIDNGIHIWVDGVWKFGARDPLGTSWNGISLGDVGAGTHYIQILLEDSGGGTAYQNPMITATVVPIPPAALLFLSGLLGIVGVSGRQNVTIQE